MGFYIISTEFSGYLSNTHKDTLNKELHLITGIGQVLKLRQLYNQSCSGTETANNTQCEHNMAK